MAESEHEHGHGLHLDVGHSLEFLTHKLGPLPVWGWLLGAGAGIGVVLMIRARGSGGNSSVLTPAAGTPPGGSDGSGGSSGIDYGQQIQALQSQEQSDIQGVLQSEQQQGQQLAQAISDQNASFQSALDSLGQSLQGELATIQATMPTAAPSQGPYVASLHESFAAAQGGNPNPGPVPATFSNPAPGGSWGGLSGSQIQQAFIAQAGGNVQQAAANWQKQHDAEVAQNGF